MLTFLMSLEGKSRKVSLVISYVLFHTGNSNRGSESRYVRVSKPELQAAIDSMDERGACRLNGSNGTTWFVEKAVYTCSLSPQGPHLADALNGAEYLSRGKPSAIEVDFNGLLV
jgi:hypothetical protein